MESINKDYDKVIEHDPRNINSSGSIMVNLESEMNIFDPGDKLTNRPKHSLKEIIEFINKKQK
jgi:hypothetical protein